jgi:2-methylcitrate dehydratase PrpD
MSLGLNVEETARAIALAVPAAGGVQRAFGTSAKALQVGFAADAGERATCLVVAGATADPTALDEWFGLVRGRREQSLPRAPAVPGGLAIKLFPCCYALQRPISAVQRFKVSVEAIQKVILHTPAATLQPLIHHRPATGLESKFSIEYAVAATLLDGSPGFRSFEDPAVSRPEARALLARVQTVASPGGTDLLDGELQVDILLRDGSTVSQRLALPPGAPGVPPTAEQLLAKFSDCGEDIPGLLRDLTWERATEILRRELPSQQASVVGART